MRIGIIGSGGVGQTLAAGFAAKGHEVILGARDPKANLAVATPNAMGQPPLSAWAKANPKVRIATFADAAKHGEVLVFAVKGEQSGSAIKAAGAENMAGKLVLDTTNPLAFGANGIHKAAAIQDSCLETAQRAAPKANFVKAWNCTPSSQMVDPKFKEGRADQLICGNDAKAKEQATKILKDFGWNVVDAGDATIAPYVEATAIAICNYAMKSNDWTWAMKLVRQ
ncbi:MAG: NADPH-dependent F420 reductase [Thermoplasmatota archaeon]